MVEAMVEGMVVEEYNLDVVMEDAQQVNTIRHENTATCMEIVRTLAVNAKPLRRDTLMTQSLQI